MKAKLILRNEGGQSEAMEITRDTLNQLKELADLKLREWMEGQPSGKETKAWWSLEWEERLLREVSGEQIIFGVNPISTTTKAIHEKTKQI